MKDANTRLCKSLFHSIQLVAVWLRLKITNNQDGVIDGKSPHDGYHGKSKSGAHVMTSAGDKTEGT